MVEPTLGQKDEHGRSDRERYLLIVHSALMVVTTLLKIFIIIILCFYVAPLVHDSARESRLNREQVLENRFLMREVGEAIKKRSDKLDETHKIAKRIHDLLEAIEKQSKDLKEKKKDDKE